MSVERLMRQLKGFSSPYVYNPWNDFDERYDTNQRASSIRRKQLQAYLEQRLDRAKILIIAEAVGYQGGRFTGIAMTCERMLLGHHPTVTPSMVFTGLEPKRTSNPKSEYIIKPTQKEKGFNEPTDSVVWNAMLEANIDPYEVVLWNIFSIHPFKRNRWLDEPDSYKARIRLRVDLYETVVRFVPWGTHPWSGSKSKSYTQ